MRVTDGIWSAAAARPQAIALVVDGREAWRYGEWCAAVTAAGSHLRRQGLPAGGRLAICLPNGSAHLLAFCAAARFGWVAVTLPPGSGGAELAALLGAARPAGVVATPQWFRRHGSVLAAATPGARRIAVPPEWPGPGPGPGPGWDAAPAPTPSGAPAPGLPLAGPDDLFYIGYTSGSTGQPKGVARRHAAWVQSFAAASREFGITAAERFLVPGPLAFSASLFAALHVLETGGTLYLETAFRPRRVWARLREHAITGAFMVPTLYAALLADRRPPAQAAAAPAPSPAAPALQRLISCGEKLTPALRQELQAAFPAAAIYEYYGSSELGFTTLLPPEWAHRPLVAGRPFSGVEIAIRHADGTPCAPGTVGILYARSTMLAAGYDRGGTVVPLTDPDGWATAGDLVRMDADGLVWLCGRVDEAVKAGGAQVYPAAVEATLLAHPAVAAAVVAARSHPRRGAALVAAVAPRPGASLTAAALRAWCAQHLAAHERPRHVLVLPNLPRTPLGKVDRTAVLRRLSGLREP